MQIKELKIEVKAESPIRIGAKRDPFSRVDQPIAKIGDRIIVPGTTLKGALRHEIEKYLVEKYSKDVGMKPCLPSSQRTISIDEGELINKGIYKGQSCAYPRGGDYICPACYLLGAQGIVGFMIIPFLVADAIPTEMTGIRIDRFSGKAADSTKRDYQILPEGTKFKGILTILLKDEIRDWELGKPRILKEPTLGDKWLENYERNKDNIIKEFIKERLESIKILGGLKSSGAGRVKITVTEM